MSESDLKAVLRQARRDTERHERLAHAGAHVVRLAEAAELAARALKEALAQLEAARERYQALDNHTGDDGNAFVALAEEVESDTLARISAEQSVPLDPLQVTALSKPDDPNWRKMLLTETGWLDYWATPICEAVTRRFRTAGELADALAAGETFGLADGYVLSMKGAVIEISQDDERPITFARPEPSAPIPAPVTKLSALDNFPDVVADLLFMTAISTVETLLEHIEAEQTGDMPLRNKAFVFFLDRKVKRGPAATAADVIAEHVASQQKLESEAPLGEDPPAPVGSIIRGKSLGPGTFEVKKTAFSKVSRYWSLTVSNGVGLDIYLNGVKKQPDGRITTGYVDADTIEVVSSAQSSVEPPSPAPVAPVMPVMLADLKSLSRVTVLKLARTKCDTLAELRAKADELPKGASEDLRVFTVIRSANIGRDEAFAATKMIMSRVGRLGTRFDARALEAAHLRLKNPDRPYGWEITYRTNRGEELTCHYVGKESTARSKAKTRTGCAEIRAAKPMTEREYVRAFGRGRM